MGITARPDLDELVTSVARVTLLEANGTPTDDFRWDRKVRLDGDMESGINVISPRVRLRLAEGEPGLWRWIAAHAQSGGNAIMPIALEVWQDDPQRGWVRHVLPQLNLDEAPSSTELLDDRSWPVWLWTGVPNRHWREEKLRETPLAWMTVPTGRPADAPPPLTRRELDQVPVEVL